MSSSHVRTVFKNFISASVPTEKLADLTGGFEELEDFLSQYSISMNEKWIGIEFIGNDNVPITIGSGNTGGKYREHGAVYIHVVDVAKLAVHDSILARAEVISNFLLGQRLGDVVVNSVTPPNFEQGATISFEGGFVSCTFIVDYQRDRDF